MKPEDTYEGQVFHPSLGNHVAEGRLSLLQWTLQFQSEEVILEMPYQDLEIRWDVKEGRISFHHPTYPDWAIYTSDSSILEHRVFTQRTQLRRQLQAVAQRHLWRNAAGLTVGCLLVFALVSMLVTWASGQMVRAIASRIPAAWEKEQGDKLLAELKEEFKESDDPQLKAQLQQVTEPLTGAIKGEFRFHLVDNPIPNASAWPGGHVMVHTGLLKLAGSPEELAGALAHELAHVTERHHFRQTISERGPYYVTRLFFKKNSFAGLLATGSRLLLRQNFSRKYEREADEVAWRYLLAANINPRGEIELLKKLKEVEERRGVVGLSRSAWSSHPPTEERIQRLEAKWSRLKQQTGFMEFKKPE